MIRAPAEKKVAFIFLLLLTAATLCLSVLIASPFLTPIITAILFAVATYPVFVYLLRIVGSYGSAALLTTLIVFLALLLPTVLIVNALANETAVLYGSLNENKSANGGWAEYLSRLTERPLGWIEWQTGISREVVRNAALERLRNLSASLLNWAKSLAINVTGTIVDTFVMLFTLFFLVRDGRAILDRVGTIIPLPPGRYAEILKTISDSIIANVYGVVAVSLAQASLGALGYWIAGLPNILLWTVMTAFFSMIPLAGAAAVWGVGVIYLAMTAHWGKALFLLFYGAGVISMADNIVRPLVLSGRVRLNALLIFFSLLGGVQVFGIIGLFVGPITISVAMALVRILMEEVTELRRPAVDNEGQIVK